MKYMMKKINVWFGNILAIPEDKKIVCSNCGTVQHLANWHYQKCHKCDYYMYDTRWDI